MPPLNLRLESLPQGHTLLTCDLHLTAGREVHAQQLRFAVRLSKAAVERVVAEFGPDRAVSLLWTHFRTIPSGQASIDSEGASLEEWARAVEAFVAEVREQSR